MPRLTNRNMQIPGGLRMYIPQTKWQSRPNSSFQGICEAMARHLNGNPDIAKQLGFWPVDMRQIESTVDAYNAALCEKMGWNDYIVQEGGNTAAALPFLQNSPPEIPASQARPAPPQPRGVLAHLRSVAAGGVSLVEWIGSGAESVPKIQSQARADVCVKCQHNTQGPFDSFFTVPVSEAIRRELNQRRMWSLNTTHDEKLGVCEICSCPIRLMLHVPLEQKIKHMPKEVRNQLPPHCWVNLESQK